MNVKFTRTLRGGEQGCDVEGVGRALARAGHMGPLSKFMQKAYGVRRTYGSGKEAAVRKLQAKHGAKQDGVYALREHKWLVADGGFDAYAARLMLDYQSPAVIVFPMPHGWNVTVNPNGLHPTAGINGSWALDFMCAGGTPVCAPEDGWIVRLSGRDPAAGAEQTVGIYGWSLHLETRAGYRYFFTHLGLRNTRLYPGMKVEAGDILGHVGNWPGNPPRSHLHLGVTSPLGVADAKKRIVTVAKAPRVL